MCLTFIRGYFFGKMYHWSVDSSNARNWYTNKWTLVIQLIKPLSDWLEQPFIQAACMFDYVGFGFLSLVFARNPIVTGFHICAITLLLRNWSRQEINRKRVIQVIRVIARILLLPWIQWIQVIERYETNSFFSVEISWITRITDPSVQTNRPLMSIIWVLR